MKVQINGNPHELPQNATLADAAQSIGAQAPFAAALNLQFVPKSHYLQTLLQPGDQIEIIRPVTGG